VIINKIPQDLQAKLYMALEGNLNSIKRRNVGYAIYCYSNEVASVNLMISGRRGTVQKAVMVVYDTVLLEWNVYADGYQYVLGSLSEIQAIFKSITSRETNIVTKI
jgi:hypothetical protein